MATQPNLLFLLPDQLRADFLGCYGADFIETPQIDRLAREGTRYERAYSVSPICVPARASLLTGLNALKTGVTDNGQWLRPDLAACGIRTWPELLAEQGYYTAAVGKMHFYPWDLRHGFQYRVIAEDKRWLHIRDDYAHFLQANGYRKLHGNEHEGYYEHKGAIVNRIPWDYSVDHFVGQQACHFIQTYGHEGPFALMVGFPGPHCPYDPVPEFLEGLDPAAMPPAIPEVPGDTPKLRRQNIEGNRLPWNGVDYSDFSEAHKQKIRAHYAALVRQIDVEVGDILETLEAEGLLEKTVILFASDHGDYLGDHNLIGKGSFFESSIHVPLIVRLPGAAPAERRSDLVELSDITATLLHLGGAKLPSYLNSRPLPGLGLPEPDPRDYLLGLVANGWMIYDGRWKLCKYATGEILLFDLEEDPAEQRNLLREEGYQEQYLRLEARLTQELMRSFSLSHEDRRVYRADLSGDPAFGKEGWVREYPRKLE